jgi:hypothetical protein
MKPDVQALLICASVVAAVCDFAGQQLRIGIIDFYGLNRLSPTQLRQTLTFKEGDNISLEEGRHAASVSESERRLSQLPGVSDARTMFVCCDDGRVIAYVGIVEDGAPVMHFRTAPTGTVRLPADVAAAGDEFDAALTAALQHGDVREDHSQGHALNHDRRMRAVQNRFIKYAARGLPLLRRVLHESSDPAHRALAAQVLGYVADKRSVVDDLIEAMSDPDDNVRNNAMRTLFVFLHAAPSSSRRVPPVPFQPFVALLNSPVWSDRNKASLALAALSEKRDPALLTELRREALAPLIEMSRWTSQQHAHEPFMIVARIAGYSDRDAHAAWDRGERELVISAALKRQ